MDKLKKHLQEAWQRMEEGISDWDWNRLITMANTYGPHSETAYKYNKKFKRELHSLWDKLNDHEKKKMRSYWWDISGNDFPIKEKMDEGFFGLGKKNNKYSTIEEIQEHIQKALNKEDGMTFTFFYGNGIRLAAEIAGLIGMTNLVRPGILMRLGDSFEDENMLLEKAMETQATCQVFCIDDGERHKMRNFLKSIDPRVKVNDLGKIAGYMEEMDASGIEDLSVKGFGKEAKMWLDSFKGKNNG